MRSLLYKLLQCTWGFLQTLLGLAVFLAHYHVQHFWYHGALITVWECKSSVSLGLFVFVAKKPFFAKEYQGQIPFSEAFSRLLVHEYGHTIQSLILGPLYLFVIGIPSSLWARFWGSKRRSRQIPYGAFFTEKWANHLGERVTGEKSIGNLVLDS